MSNPFIEVINRVLPEPQAGLLNGILFGIRAGLPGDLYQNLILTGTIHIIALSGQNITILERIISEITLIFGRRNSIIITIGTIIGFVLFVGAQVTIIRAAIMGSLSLLAVYFGKQNWSLLSLFFASIVMLIYKPVWITDVSFQLSFLATLGIILLVKSDAAHPTNFFGEVKRELSINLRTTLAAQLFTLPVIMYHFQRISFVSPLSNVAIGWVVAPVMVLGFATAFLGWVWLPLGQVFAWFTWVPLTFMVTLIDLTAKIPFGSWGN